MKKSFLDSFRSEAPMAILALGAAGFLTGALSLPARAEAGGAGSPAETWAAEGVLADACQCEVFCPCEFASKPTFGHCDDAAIMDIHHGHFGAVNLDGQRIVIVSQSPKGERLVDTVGRLNFARIYVPENASDDQVQVLAELARRVFGEFKPGASRISPDEKVERAKMDIVTEPGRYSARIPGILDVDMAPVIGGDGKTPVVIRNNAFTAIGCGDVTVSQSKTYRYTAEGNDWNYGGRSASIRTFSMGGRLDEGPMARPATMTDEMPAGVAGGHEHHHH